MKWEIMQVKKINERLENIQDILFKSLFCV